jgi:hypothetical protein
MLIRADSASHWTAALRLVEEHARSLELDVAGTTFLERPLRRQI